MICSTFLNVPDTFQFYIPFALSTLSLISTILILFTFIRFPRLRLNSGKMVLFIVICELNMHWLILLSLNYTKKEDKCFDSGHAFEIKSSECYIFGYFFIFFQWCYIIMNAFIIHNLYYVLNFAGDNDNFHQRFKHYVIISIGFSIIILIYASTDIADQVNIGFMGICGVAKGSSLQFVAIVYLLVILPLCIYVFINSVMHYKSLLKLIKEEKNTDSIESSKSSLEHETQRVYLFLNISYILLFVIDWLPLAILNFMSWWCAFWVECNDHDNFSEVFETIALLLVSGNGLFIFLIRIREPTLKKFYMKIFRNRRLCKNSHKLSLKSQLLDKALVKSRLNDPLIPSLAPEVQVIPEQTISLEPQKDFHEDRNLCYLQMFYLLRVILLKQLGGIDIKLSSCESPFGSEYRNFRMEDMSHSSSNYPQMNNNNINTSNTTQNNTEEKIPWPNHFYTKFDVEMYDMNKMLEEMNNEDEKALFMNKGNFKDQIVTALTYCKRFFEWLRLNKFKTNVNNMIDSFNVIKNQHIIFKNTEKKSAYHEFATYDYQYIIAVISKQVKKFLLDDFFKNYHEHINSKHFSFLPNIIGLFSFQFQGVNTNPSYSILIYENPYSHYNFYKTKELLEKPPKEILSIYYVQAEKTKKKTLYKCEDSSYEIEKSDLKLKSDDKSALLNYLYDDLNFLSNLGAYDYRFYLAFFKFEDKLLLESTFLMSGDDIEKNKRNKINGIKNKFYLQNKIGFCSGILKNLFKFIQKKKTNKKSENLKFDVAINKEVSINNPMNYCRFLYEQAQDL